jgi:hypothetical protein
MLEYRLIFITDVDYLGGVREAQLKTQFGVRSKQFPRVSGESWSLRVV